MTENYYADRWTLELERAVINQAKTKPILNAFHNLPRGDRRPINLKNDNEIEIYTRQAEADKIALKDINIDKETRITIITPTKRATITADQINNYEPKSQFTVLRGSVTDMHVGAIVNAANETLLGGGGVDGAIHRLAGPNLRHECATFGGCSTGDAVITDSYNMTWTDAIIHTVGPIYDGIEQDDIDLSKCITNSLNLAKRNNIVSIAFPCISMGVYGFPLNRAARIITQAANDWIKANPDPIMNIYVCCYKDEEFKAFQRAGN